MEIRKRRVSMALSLLVLFLLSLSKVVADTDKSLAERSRQEQITLWEYQLHYLRQNKLNDALVKFHHANARLEAAKKNKASFIPQKSSARLFARSTRISRGA
ncbi:unnamed protein product [Phytomonas sp. Hart1]|nr:unnamed protein product [Phytomonas sp. Hart1]|eukprot:CCW67467.1 unnamed protein product [Phytomonas sp. isolate Hart1]